MGEEQRPGLSKVFEGIVWTIRTAPGAIREMGWEGLRWSYLIMVVVVLIGALLNLLVPHGWTVWPLVGVVGILLYMSEAADRNASGIPLIYVYALAGAAVLVWVALVMVLSVVNPLILWLGILGIGGYCARDWLARQQRERLVEARRTEGLCIHCGANASIDEGICPNCGRDPDPDRSQSMRIQAVMGNSARSGNARAVLKGQTLAQSARAKEGALLASRNRGGGRRKS